VTYCADPNFAFVWNKADFRDAGLDPNAPPRSLEELDRLVRRLNKYQGQGKGRRFLRIGLVPWGQYGSANSLFTWGWAFGGSFYDPESHRITCDDPKVVSALEWMCRYAKEYDVTRIASLQAGFGTAELNPLYLGKLSMSCLHISGIEEIRKYAPNLQYGMTYIPAPEGGEQHTSWVGGWCMAIPKGARHPKEAWELIRWMCGDPKGTSVVAEKTGLFPGYRESPYFARIRSKPGYGMFLKILEECRHQRPVMPAQAYYMGALQRAVDDAIYGKKTPKQALADARIETQRELDLVLGSGK
jgi:ABC-type glycerol-3-phosphate transport system substrate-binding protein